MTLQRNSNMLLVVIVKLFQHWENRLWEQKKDNKLLDKVLVETNIQVKEIKIVRRLKQGVKILIIQRWVSINLLQNYLKEGNFQNNLILIQCLKMSYQLIKN